MEKQTAIKKPAKNLNKPAYIIFLAAGIGFLVTKENVDEFIYKQFMKVDKIDE